MSPMRRFRQHLLAEYDKGAALLAPTKRLAYAWAAWSLLSFLAVIFGDGPGVVECMVSGVLTGIVSVRRLHLIAESEHRDKQASYRKANVGWWLDRLHWSEVLAERVAAHQLLTYWGETGHRPVNPIHSPAERLGTRNTR